jgi:glutaredoxin-like YruB-family protein
MDVRVYTTPSCPWCKKAKEYLKSKGVDYTEVDVHSDSEAAKEMMKLSKQMGVPVIVAGEKVIVGFSEEEIDEALK